MRRIAIFLLLAATTISGVAQQKSKNTAKPEAVVVQSPLVQDREFQSKSLGRPVRYRVVLPGDYARTTRHYPALYLLHGLYGDYENWETRTDLVHYAEKYKFIIVMPDAGNSWYVNSATIPQNRYEDFIVDDMVTEAEHSFRIIRSPHRRAIAGLSMGGYGALKFALKYPGEFVVAASISGALDPTTDLVNIRPDFEKELTAAFGPMGTETRARNDLYFLAQNAVPADTPYLYIDDGTGDWALAGNRKFVSILSSRKFRYEYHEMPGIHDWEYWDRRIPNVLQLVGEMVSKP